MAETQSTLTALSPAASKQHSLLNTTFPVMLPHTPELHLNQAEFDAHIRSLFPSDSTLPIHTKDSTTVDEKQEPSITDRRPDESKENAAPFMAGLLSDPSAVPSLDTHDGKMLTENGDVAFRTSGQALVDLFVELEEVVSAARLKELLDAAWAENSKATLNIIWNARSIHLGKGSRNTFYRAVGWLAEKHPRTLIANLPWLVRPLIQKKVPKKDDAKAGEDEKKLSGVVEDVDSDFEMVEKEDELDGQPESKKVKLEEDPKLAEFDIKYGVSHGYWKDLLNLLALAVNDQLKCDSDIDSVLKRNAGIKPCKRDWTEGHGKGVSAARHERVIAKLKSDKFYQALHLTVARLFAQQLLMDTSRLKSGRKSQIKHITLAAKWAPTHKGMHDQQTCIVSSIAELLYPTETACTNCVDRADRETYLKYARIAYQSQTLSPLRKHLSIVERDITAENFAAIQYERVPSLAMKQYTPLFAKKDFDHFDHYLDKVAEGKSSISGAVLLPSTLVRAIYDPTLTYRELKATPLQAKLNAIAHRTADAQWNTLVQRIKDSGTLDSSIAVCDVSGSMYSPIFRDSTCPMTSSIGLSLLLAEVTKPPFGGAMITFSEKPEIFQVGGAADNRSLHEKVQHITKAAIGFSTDFVAVFEKLILPMAKKHKLKQQDMVKRVCVFSDMQFNQADRSNRWSSSYVRIKKEYAKAGYEMPELVFWNLAGGRAGYEQSGGDEVAPKPVQAWEEGTSMVSGYSQGMLKVFLDEGVFGEAEEEVVEEKGESEEEEALVVVRKKKDDSVAVMRRAVGHEAYRMLRVVDEGVGVCGRYSV